VLFLATGTAHAYDAAKDYRPQYDTRPWESKQPPPTFPDCYPDLGEDTGLCVPLPKRHPLKPHASAYIKEGLACLLEEGFKQDEYGADGYQCGINPNKLTAIQRRCIQATFNVSEPADDRRNEDRNDRKMRAAYDRCFGRWPR
jgi:hypothetical protein